MLDLTELKEVEAAATPEPWSYSTLGMIIAQSKDVCVATVNLNSKLATRRNGFLITLSRNLVPEMIKEIEIAREFKILAIEEFEAGRVLIDKLRTELAKAREALDTLSSPAGFLTGHQIEQTAREALRAIDESGLLK